MFDAQRGVPEGIAGESAVAIGKALPGVTTSGLLVAGVPLENWVLILTATLLIVQLGHAIYKIIRDLRRGGNDRDGSHGG